MFRNPDGSLNKNQINLLSGTMFPAFGEVLWVLTNGDVETANLVADLIVKMNNPEEQARLFMVLQVCYGLLGIKMPKEAIDIANDPEALAYFLYSGLIDYGETIKEYVTLHSH